MIDWITELFSGKGFKSILKPSFNINKYCIKYNDTENIPAFIAKLEEIGQIKKGSMKPNMLPYMVYIPYLDMVNSCLYVEMWCNQEVENNMISIVQFLELIPDGFKVKNKL